MPKTKEVFCIWKCPMLPHEKKSKSAREKHPSVCKRRQAKWKTIRDENRRVAAEVEAAAVVSEEEEGEEEGEEGEEEVNGGEEGEEGGEEEEEEVVTGVVVKKQKTSGRVMRAAEKECARKGPKEKKATDFKGDDDAMVLGSGLTKKKAMSGSKN